MHFKWDSDVARDITNELNRLEEELGDCTAEVERGAAILRDMQGGQLSEIIERYVSLAGKMKRSLMDLEDCFRSTGRGITRANEMFEDLELRLRQRAEGMSGEAQNAMLYADASACTPEPPVFFNVPGQQSTAPLGIGTGAFNDPWPALPGIRQTVVIDQFAFDRGVGMPLWLQGVMNAEDVR